MEKKVAVILCGSGFKDGSEIRESVAVLWALSRYPVQVQCYAPDAPQASVVNCLTGELVAESRNQLVESARIARGDVLSLEQLDVENVHAVILPGGFGAAKNLCDFAEKGARGTVRKELRSRLVLAHKLGKPLGAV